MARVDETVTSWYRSGASTEDRFAGHQTGGRGVRPVDARPRLIRQIVEWPRARDFRRLARVLDGDFLVSSPGQGLNVLRSGCLVRVRRSPAKNPDTSQDSVIVLRRTVVARKLLRQRPERARKGHESGTLPGP